MLNSRRVEAFIDYRQAANELEARNAQGVMRNVLEGTGGTRSPAEELVDTEGKGDQIKIKDARGIVRTYSQGTRGFYLKDERGTWNSKDVK